jgi:hypothetical protein
LPVAARFRAHRVTNELAAGRAIVAHGRSFSRSRAESAGGDSCSDGGETSCFLNTKLTLSRKTGILAKQMIFTEGIREGKSVSPDFDLAVKRHQLLDAIQKTSDTGIRQIL